VYAQAQLASLLQSVFVWCEVFRLQLKLLLTMNGFQPQDLRPVTCCRYKRVNGFTTVSLWELIDTTLAVQAAGAPFSVS